MPKKETIAVAHNTIVQLVGRGVILILSMITLAIVTRILSPVLYGDYVIIMTLMAFATSFADFGINQIAVREMAKNTDNVDELVGDTVLIKTVFTIAIILLSIIVISLTGYSLTIKFGFTISLISLVMIALQSGYQSWLQANLKVYHITVADVISKIASFVLLLVIAWKSSDVSNQTALMWIIISSVIVSITSCAYILWQGFRYVPFALSWDYQRYRHLIKLSAPLWVVGLLSLVHYRVDMILLSVLKTSYEVGVYGLAYRFLDIILVIPGLFMASVFPLMSQAAFADGERGKRIIQKSLNFLLILALPITFGVIYTAPQIIRIFGGDDYTDSVGVLRILSLAVLGSFANAALSAHIVAHNGQKFVLNISLIAVISNIILNFILISRFSYYGSAAATAITEIGVALTTLYIVHHFYGFKPTFTIALKAVISVVVMLIFLWLLHIQSLILNASIGMMIYFGCLYLVGGIEKELLIGLFPRNIYNKVLSNIKI